MTCYFCEKKSREHWGGYWCENCRKLKNLGNVYGFDRIYNILEKCCIRNEAKLEKKIESQKKDNSKKKEQTDESYEKPKTRSKIEKI